MKTDDLGLVTQAIGQLLAGPLTDKDAIHLAKPAAVKGKMAYGLHCHDTWELFCPLRKDLRFVIGGNPPVTIPPRHLLVVPPNCLHLGVNDLPQSPELTLLVMNLPGNENPYGGVSVGSACLRSACALSPAAFTAWTANAGAAPGTVMTQVAQALDEGPWGGERALGLLRVLVAAYAQVITHPQVDRQTPGASRVAEAQLLLQTHYYKPALSVEAVAATVGSSASHLGFLFRETTGRTLHQTLLDIRLRRATDLLTRTSLSIKEIAALTGWSSQLYFSAAYRRRHGKPPSALRSAAASAARA